MFGTLRYKTWNKKKNTTMVYFFRTVKLFFNHKKLLIDKIFSMRNCIECIIAFETHFQKIQFDSNIQNFAFEYNLNNFV